jgi:hypothetical protein
VRAAGEAPLWPAAEWAAIVWAVGWWAALAVLAADSWVQDVWAPVESVGVYSSRRESSPAGWWVRVASASGWWAEGCWPQ